MYRLVIYFVITACFCASSFGQNLRDSRPAINSGVSNIKKFHLNAGTHTEFFNQVQTDDSGTMRTFDLSPVIGAGMTIDTALPITFLPEVNWVLPQKTGEKIFKNLFMTRADFGYLPVDWFRIRLGTSIMWLNQHGSGGKAEINNGNTTSTFYYPDENRSSFNNTLDVGAELLLADWAVRIQTYTYAIFKEERRNVSYSILLSYYWDR